MLVFAILAMAAVVSAHDIPRDATVHAFLKPEGTRLRLLVRVPLETMRDVNVPLRGEGFVDLSRADQVLRDAAVLWIAGNIEIDEEGRRLGPPVLVAARVSLPDRAFVSYAEALAHVMGERLPAGMDLPWEQARMDVLFDYPIASETSRFSVRPAFGRLASHVVTILQFLPPGGGVHAFEFASDPGLVRLDPRWHQAAWSFVRLGFLHILDGPDHLLFLFCLVLPIRRLRPLVLVVTAFTAAHSLTLIASASSLAPGGLWFPALIETLIAVSIVYMALENIALRAWPAERSGSSIGIPRWALAFGFGLVHGFGFSFALRDSLQLAGSHLLASLLSFNVGVELGQLAVLAAMIPALHLLFRFVVPERIGTILVSALVAHTAWHWTADRWGRLRQFAWPSIDAASLASVIRALTALTALAAVAWILMALWARRSLRGSVPEPRRERGV